MKKIIIAIVIIVLLGLLYVGRHSLKSMLSGAPTASNTSPLGVPAVTGYAVLSDNIYLVKTGSTKEKYMTDFAGMTLYTYDKDTAGVSNCNQGCVTNWPVYTSGAVAQKIFPTNISVITRSDGSQQFAYKGMPLYYNASDKSAGDITGDGFGGVWHIVKM